MLQLHIRVVLVVVVGCVGALSPAALSAADADSHSRGNVNEYNVALGVECTHCHVAGRWQDDSKPPKATARKMTEMLRLLNGKLRGVGEVRCWTCHAGQAQPSTLPQPSLDVELARWPESLAAASEGTKLRMAMYSASTGLRCGECHDVTNWKRVDTDRMRMVPRMMALLAIMQPVVQAPAQPQCFTCHKGSSKPQKERPGS